MSAAEKFLETGQTAKAKTAAEQALAKKPQDRSALVVLSKVLLLEGQLDKAEQHIARAEKQGTTADTLLLRANLASQRGQLEPAAGYFRQALSQDPKRAEGFFGLGLVLFKQEKTAEALVALTKATQLQPKNAVFVYRLGQVLIEAGQTDKGIQSIAQAITLQPRFLAPYLSLIQALVEEGRALQARRVVDEGLRAMPNHPRLLSALTAISLGMGDSRTSFRAATTVANQRPKDPKAQANLALLLLLKGQRQDALHICRTMESLGLATAELKMIEATAYEAAEPPAYEKAVAAYEEAMGLEPGGWKAPNNLGQLLMRMPATPPEKHMPRAITVLEEAVRRKADQPEPHLNLALAYSRAGDKAKAKAQAQAVLTANLPEGDEVREQAERLLKVLG
ncbi:tetratricopeptide repeat protein [Hyalangium sp.]|uniref:tetratricopeptide repeat protein n=1 Tax=Hyalangium sp. TaxID=2028555 RepID=UPI002D407747|nr:tetratricopeptide repeat protein [Hyalangium sp.]HYI02416.1 tetratricopeptide repeat protein [Hyalangium sp.]